MQDREFNLRLNCRYESDKNQPINLEVDVLAGGEWKKFMPDVETPGFLLFVYALFSCQLRYMRMNSAERNIVLESTAGELKLLAGEFWDVKKVAVSFRSVLKAGCPTADDIAYIKERMTHCPVSTNLPKHVTMGSEVIFGF